MGRYTIPELSSARRTRLLLLSAALVCVLLPTQAEAFRVTRVSVRSRVGAFGVRTTVRVSTRGGYRGFRGYRGSRGFGGRGFYGNRFGHRFGHRFGGAGYAFGAHAPGFGGGFGGGGFGGGFPGGGFAGGTPFDGGVPPPPVLDPGTGGFGIAAPAIPAVGIGGGFGGRGFRGGRGPRGAQRRIERGVERRLAQGQSPGRAVRGAVRQEERRNDQNDDGIPDRPARDFRRTVNFRDR